MDKIKRIFNCVIPVTLCNFKCHYCYIAQTNSFEGKINELQYPVEHMISALTVERLGGPCMMNMCAVGETLLAPYLFDLCKGLINNGHYVTIVTNGSLAEKIKPFCQMSKKEKAKLFFKFSYQYLELKRLHLLEKFFENVKMVKDSGISFSIELTANDESIEYIDELNEVCVKNVGASPHIIESRDNNLGFKKLTRLSNEEHMKAWTKIDTPLITFQDSLWDEKREEFCYAGSWVSTLYIESGNLAPCFGGGPIFQNIFENITDPIHFCPIGNKCPWNHCYAAHVLLTLGAIPNLDTPYYDQMRNRTVKDSSWLTPEMQSFMHSKLCESNKEYSPLQKSIINWYQNINLHNTIQRDKEFEDALLEILGKQKIKKIALLDDGLYTEALMMLLSNSKLKVKYILIKDYLENQKSLKRYIKHKIKYLAKKLIRREKVPYLNKYDLKPKVDAILITDILNYEKIKKELNTKCILLTDLGVEDYEK